MGRIFPYIVSLLIAFLSMESALMAFPLRTLKPGDEVPDFTLPALSGGEGNVLGGEGRITVILFWGTSSEGKRERGIDLLRTLQTIGEDYGDQNVVVRSVNIDKDSQALLKQIVQDEGIVVPVLMDRNEELYGVYGLFIFPTVAIVDRDGTLKTAVGYTHNIHEIITGHVKVMLGLMTTEELERDLKPEEVVEPPPNVLKAARRVNLGKLLLQKGLLDMAAIEFEKAVELDPNNAEAHAELGALHVHRGEYEKALTELHNAIALNPDSTETRIALGAMHHGRGNFEEAVHALEGILEVEPTNVAAMRELGSVYEDMGRIEKALEYYKAALEAAFNGEHSSK